MTWLLNEDAALKEKFIGLTVTDGTAPPSGRPVAVRFRLPETELADATFPMIVLDHAAISKADDREHRGMTTLPYIPEGNVEQSYQVYDDDWNLVTWDPQVGPSVNLSPIRVPDYPIPYNIDYDVTVYARKQNHITQLVAALTDIERIPSRFGYVQVGADGTTRTLDLLGGPEIVAEKDRDGKRIFRAVYSVRVVSELNLYGYSVANNWAQDVEITLERLSDPLG